MRVAEFDREQVLQSAMNAFLTKGYNQTSMQDLKQATGLHPGSIYCAFGNKRGLLMAALAHYAQIAEQKFNDSFVSQPTVVDGFRCYFESLLYPCEHQSGCLLQIALNDVYRQDKEIEGYICQMLADRQKLIAEKIEVAQQQGEISPGHDPQLLSHYLMMSIFGLRDYYRMTPDPAIFHSLIEQVLRHLK